MAKQSKTDLETGIGKVELTELLEAGVHFGHQAKRWHPKMAPYIWQARDEIHIFDLLKTQACLLKAGEAAKALAAEGKIIVFVATKRQAQEIAKEEAIRCGMPYVASRWAGGLITNWEQIKKSIEDLVKSQEGLAKGEFKYLTKKERLLIDRKITKLEHLFGGLVALKGIPDALFIVDTKREKTAIAEANKKGITIFGMVDSNADPSLVAYPIPGNDDAVRSIKLLVSTFASAVLKGRMEWEKRNKE